MTMALGGGGGSLSELTLSTNDDTFDAFGRFRVASTSSLFDSTQQYNSAPLYWDTVLAGSGGSAHSPNESATNLTVSGAGDSAIRQTKQYHRYRPGKSMLAAATFVMGAASDNVIQRVGLFDVSNGIFLQRSGSAISFVRRTKASGVVVDNAVAKADWNVDPFDGTGPSRKTLDLTKAQILMIDLQWLGVGRVRVGFDIDGQFWVGHEFRNANVLSTVYMTTANLPVRYEISASGATSGSPTLKQICCMVASEGGFENEFGLPRSGGTGIAEVGVTSRRPICSVRPKLTFNSIANRGLIFPESVDVSARTNACFWELVHNGTLTGATWAVDPGTNALGEIDLVANAISGGEVLASGYVAASASVRAGVSSALLTRLPLTLSYDALSSTPVSLVVTSMTGTSNVAGTITWREFY